MESVISHCRKDEFNLTEESCHSQCRGRKVKEEYCNSFCKIKGFPTVHWHKDVANSSFLKFAQSKTNRPMRKRYLKTETLPLKHVQNPWDGDVNHTESNTMEIHRANHTDPLVIQTANLTECFQKSCVSYSTMVTCINLNRSLEPSISHLIGTSWRKPLRPSGYRQCTNSLLNSILYQVSCIIFILEDWRLLWKANWTHYAAGVLKNFETDVIFKVEEEWVVSIVWVCSGEIGKL